MPVLLLEHRGRTSGRTYTTPLLYLRDGDDLVVVASQGGLPENPQWYRNLVHDPAVSTHVDGIRTARTARVADAEERAALWPRLTALYADFDTYQSWTDRVIPVVVLTPRSEDTAGA